jgi:MFS family permease
LAAPASAPDADPNSSPSAARIPRQLGALLVAVIAFGFAHSSYFLLPKFLAVELHADASQIGLYSAVTWVANVVLVSFAGVWIDRRGRLPFAYFGAVVMALTCVGFLAVDSLGPLLFALRLAHGVAFTFFFIATQTLAADLAPPERLGQVLGYYGSGFVLTNAAAPAAAEWLAGRAGWEWVFTATAALAVLSVALLFFVREHATHHSDGSQVPGIGAALARPGFARVLGISSLAGVAFAAAFTFHQPFALSLGIARVSDFFVAYSLTAMVVRGPLGGFTDRAGRLRVTRVSLAAYALASLAMFWLGDIGLIPTGALFGLAHGLFYPSLNAVALEGAGSGVRAKVTGLFNGAFNVGFSGGSFALGYVALGLGYVPVYALAAVSSALALALVPRRTPEGE